MLAFVASPHVYNMTHPCSGICREPLWAKGFLSSYRFPAIHPSSSSIHPCHPSIHCQRVFFNSNYTHSLRMSPTCHILHHTAPTGCVGPERLVRALQVSFFFFLLFFLILTTPTACVSHQHAIYSTHTAPTACVGPKRVVRAPRASFFFLLLFL